MKKLTSKFPRVIREIPNSKKNRDNDKDIITSDCLDLYFSETKAKKKKYDS